MVEAVLAGLAQLRVRNAEALSDGLGAKNARRCLDLALDAITVEGLKAEIGTTPTPPQEVCIVCARGVFTAPIEWIAPCHLIGLRHLQPTTYKHADNELF